MKTVWLFVAVALVCGTIGFCFGQASADYTTVKAGDFLLGYVFPKMMVTRNGQRDVFVLSEEVEDAIEAQCWVEGAKIVCDHEQQQRLKYLKSLMAPSHPLSAQ